MLLNLASDKPFVFVWCQDNNQMIIKKMFSRWYLENNSLLSGINLDSYDVGFVFFDRRNLENQLPKFFKEVKVNEIYVITGPWYFSSTRIWVEVVNILKFLWVIDNIYFLDKLALFRQFMQKNNLNEVYLFSWNKNKFILLQKNDYKEIFKKDLDENILVEELFEINLDNPKISYKELLQNYDKNFQWDSTLNYIYPYYIFEPIVQKNC